MELARSGCNIACLDLDLEAAQKLCDELKDLGVKANAYQVKLNCLINLFVLYIFLQNSIGFQRLMSRIMKHWKR